jgi:hypothetical protein
MTDPSKESGVIQALLDRFQKLILPQALAMKERVDAGETLSSVDMQFLKEVLDAANKALPLVDRHPEYKELAARATRLYNEITAQALENEKKS